MLLNNKYVYMFSINTIILWMNSLNNFFFIFITLRHISLMHLSTLDKNFYKLDFSSEELEKKNLTISLDKMSMVLQ